MRKSPYLKTEYNKREIFTMNITRLEPAYKNYIWGGTRLNREYNKTSPYDITAESWELSCHDDGLCVIADGAEKGRALKDVIAENPDILGKNGKAFDFFPILIKLIDAADKLSVQVHPDDEYALANEKSYGKTEMWYVVDAEEGASLVYGLKKDVTKEEFLDLAKNGGLMDILNFVPVKKGDVFFIRSGMIHAIGKGILIAEIQQNSNLTYRVYDYDRRDKEGSLRPLHTEKAATVADLTRVQDGGFADIKQMSENVRRLSECKYFTVDEIKVDGKYEIKNDDSFVCITAVEGEGEISGLEVKAGTSVFVPCGEKAEITGKMTLVVAYV